VFVVVWGESLLLSFKDRFDSDNGQISLVVVVVVVVDFDFVAGFVRSFHSFVIPQFRDWFQGFLKATHRLEVLPVAIPPHFIGVPQSFAIFRTLWIDRINVPPSIVIVGLGVVVYVVCNIVPTLDNVQERLNGVC